MWYVKNVGFLFCFENIINCCLFLVQANSIIQGGKLTQLVDPNLPTEGHNAEVERMTLAASLCIRQAPQNRPQMDAVSFFLFLPWYTYFATACAIYLFGSIILSYKHLTDNHQVLKLLEGDNAVLKWARSEAGLACESDGDECVMTPPAPGSNINIQSYINLAFDVEDDAASVSSNDFITANTSLEEYLRGRWSRSSSFDWTIRGKVTSLV